MVFGLAVSVAVGAGGGGGGGGGAVATFFFAACADHQRGRQRQDKTQPLQLIVLHFLILLFVSPVRLRVLAAGSQLLGLCPVGQHHVKLGAAGAIRLIDDVPTIRGP